MLVFRREGNCMPENSRTDRVMFGTFSLDAALPNLLRWLGDADVRPWYDKGELTDANLRRRFAPRAGIHPYTILIDGQPVGYVQTYRVGIEPDYQRQLDVDPDTVATDLFIGEPHYRNAGWGTDVLRAFLGRIVFGEMDASLAMIAPNPSNTRAVRCYEKVGFRASRTVHVCNKQHPNTIRDELIMLLARSSL